MSQAQLQMQINPGVVATPDVSPVGAPAVAPRRALRPLIMVAIVALSLVGVQMGLSILLEHGAFETSKLQTTQSQVSRERQIVAQKLAVNEAPQTIAGAASKLGLTAVQSPMFIDLRTEKIVGTTKIPKGAKAYTTVDGNLISNAAQKEVAGTTKPVVPAAKVIAAQDAKKLAQSVAAGAQQGIIASGDQVAPTTTEGTDASMVGVPTWVNSAN